MKDARSALIVLLTLLLIVSGYVNVRLAWPGIQYRMALEGSDEGEVPGTLRGANTSLHQAVVDGDAERVERLIAEGADPNQFAEWCGWMGGTVYTPALHIAAENGDIAMMEALISMGADVTAPRWPDGDSALHVAARFADASAVEWLAKRVDPDIRNFAGRTPLFATSKPDLLVRALLRAGADPLVRDCYDQTPLDYAVQSNQHAVLRALLNDTRVADSVDAIALLASVEAKPYSEQMVKVVRTWMQTMEDQRTSPTAAPD